MVQVDGLREEALAGKKIGTTKRGIGPAYATKVLNNLHGTVGDLQGKVGDLQGTFWGPSGNNQGTLNIWAPSGNIRGP